MDTSRDAYLNMYWIAVALAVAILSALVFSVAVAVELQWRKEAVAKPGIERPGNQAMFALTDILTAYENGDAAKVEAGIEPAMVGLTLLLKAVQDAHVQQQSMRIHLRDIEVTAGKDIVVITAHWEKRYLTTGRVKPGLVEGVATFVLRRTDARWQLSGMTGANLFTSGLQ